MRLCRPKMPRSATAAAAMKATPAKIAAATKAKGRERIVPAGLDRAREHHGGAGLQREDEKDAHDGDDPVGVQPAVPVIGRAAPAEREKPVEIGAILALSGLAPTLDGAVAQGREIRQQPDRPERQGDHEIADDVDRIPIERAAELRPQRQGVGIGQVPVEVPGSAEMDDRVAGRGPGRDQGAGLGQAVQGAAPFRAEQHEHGRDQQTRRSRCRSTSRSSRCRAPR